MIKVSATKLRNHLFEYLSRVSAGETIIIHRKKQEVARLISPPISDWRDTMKAQPKLNVPAVELIKPMDDIWEEYI